MEEPASDGDLDDEDGTQSADDEEEEDEEEGETEEGGRRRPTAGRQRRLVARCETLTDGGGGTHTYAVAKVNHQTVYS